MPWLATLLYLPTNDKRQASYCITIVIPVDNIHDGCWRIPEVLSVVQDELVKILGVLVMVAGEYLRYYLLSEMNW